MKPLVQPDRLLGRIAAMATFVDPDRPPYTRRAFTPVYARAREWLAAEFRSAGLTTVVDAAGNLSGKTSGSDHGAPAIMIGSHIDTVMGGGRYDGILGVMAALEVAQTLHEQGMVLAHPLIVVDFLSEEPSDYGLSCIGSRAMSGTLGDEMLGATDAAGETLRQAIARAGGRPESISGNGMLQPGDLAAFVELHIEQGPVLEQRGIPIGVVTGIVGIRRFEVVVTGQADHAGTTPMAGRRDALVGAARLVQLVSRLASRRFAAEQLVATIGRLTVAPNAANVVPGQVRLTVEARCLSRDVLDRFFHALRDISGRALDRDGLEIEWLPVSDSSPVSCSRSVQAAIRDAAAAGGYQWLDMPSGAGHDAAQLAGIAPSGMVFVPSRAGRSHTPEEHTAPEHIVAGAQVLLDTIVALDRGTTAFT